MVSRYTNFILTIIAAALCAIAYQNIAADAYAKETGCGTFTNPCFVRAETAAGLDVKVTNWP
jgi:hypothetical protein